ncbi:MAG: hypothetical protein HOQ45_12075 [Nocardioidaceae bacterium]|nr:hypothetical protein [Nocardioidaceae bacterium]
MRSPVPRVRAAVAATLGAGVLLAAGTGAAAAGVLPGAAQDTARTVLDRVGIEVPGSNEHSAGHADQRGHSTQAPGLTKVGDAAKAKPAGTADKDLPEASEHGQTVSSTARNTDAEGADHGEEVSGVASDGRARGGGEADEHAHRPPATQPPAAQPEDPGAAGRAKADAAGTDGRANADDAGEGHRTQGGTGRP